MVKGYSPALSSVGVEPSIMSPATMPASADGLLEFGGDFRVFLEKGLGVLAALADALAVVAEPGAALLDDAGGDAEVEQLAVLGDALAVHDVELDHAEGRRQLVLHHLDPGLVADHVVALLDRADAADVEAHGGVELQGVAAGGGLGVAEHHPDLEADLVDEDHHAARLADRGGELAQGLAHEAGLQAHLASPISPSISARGTRAATESTTSTSMASERTRISAISRACSPVSGWEISRSSMLTPSLRA